MATWYVDPEGGNDSNSGNSFANRVKSFSAFTPAAGDSVRVIASPAPQSVGNATWTSNSGNVTLASALTYTIDNGFPSNTWTAAANVTNTFNTTARRYGTQQLAFTLASAFTTGLVAYKALSNLDLSAYSCLSCNFGYSGTSLATGVVRLALCSDSAGQVPIVYLTQDTFASAIGGPSGVPMLWENGGNPLPSGINSIAIYVSVKPFSSSGNLYFGNIIATTAPHTPGHLSHCCVIGKNTTGEPEWYSVQYIDGTTVNLGQQTDTGRASGSRVYYGTTETVPTYSMVGLRPRYSTTTCVPKGSGTMASPITWTGGWDRTAMSTQTGQTWFNGLRIQANFWANGSSGNGFNWHIFPDSTFGGIGSTGEALAFGGQQGRICKWVGLVDCSQFWSTYPNLGVVVGACDYELDYGVFGCGSNFVYVNTEYYWPVKIRVRRLTGCNVGIWLGCSVPDRLYDIWIGQIDSATNAVYTYYNGNNYGAFARVRGTKFANNTTDVVGSNSSTTILERPSFVSGAPVISMSASVVRMTAVGGARWDNRVYTMQMTQTVDQSVVHGTTAQSVKATLNDYRAYSPSTPYTTRLMRVAALAGKTVTVTGWVQRSDATNLGAGLMTLVGAVAGVGDQSVAASAATNAWGQVTISFTPTEDGVVDVYGYVSAPTGSASANSQSVWFGDMGVTST
jgi:hypothetical protein